MKRIDYSIIELTLDNCLTDLKETLEVCDFDENDKVQKEYLEKYKKLMIDIAVLKESQIFIYEIEDN